MTTDTLTNILGNHAEAISAAPNRRAVFAAAETAAQKLIGHRLFTIMRFNAERMVVERIHSSNPEAYPVGGQKPKRESAWRRHVLEEGKVFIGHNSDDIRWVFDDSELILSLGLQAVLNVPVKCAGRVVGTMNLLDRTAHYTVQDAETATAIAGQMVNAVDMSLPVSD